MSSKKRRPGMWRILCWRQYRVLRRIKKSRPFARLDKVAMRWSRETIWPYNLQGWAYAFYVDPTTREWVCRLMLNPHGFTPTVWTYTEKDRKFWHCLFNVYSDELEQAHIQLVATR